MRLDIMLVVLPLVGRMAALETMGSPAGSQNGRNASSAEYSRVSPSYQELARNYSYPLLNHTGPMNVSDADEFEMQKKKKLVPKWQIGLGVYLEKKVNKKLLKKAKKKKFGILSEGGPNQVLNRPISNSTKFERFQIPAALLMQKVEPEIFMVSDEKTTMNSVDKVNDTTIVSHLGDFKDGFALVDEDILDSSGDSYDVITVFDDWEIGFNDSSAVSLGKSMLGMWSILLVCTILIGCL